MLWSCGVTRVVPGVKAKSRDLYHIIGLAEGNVHAKYETSPKSRDLGKCDFWSKNRQFFKKWPKSN